MSMANYTGSVAPTSSAGAQDVVVQLNGIARQLGAWVAAFTGRFSAGTFTLGAAASTTVSTTSVQGNSIITFTPTNASAATLMGSAKALYISAINAGTSFVVSTASAAAAAGTETFSYIITTPS
jgi:hypothetical protein